MRLRMLLLVMLQVSSVTAWAESPFALTVEGRVGPYLPDLQPYHGANALDLSTGPTALQCAFGNQVRPVLLVSPQLSVFDLFGTLTLGVEGGFYSARGRKLLSTTNCTQTSDVGFQELTIFPVMVTATYRFDWALDHFRFPLVPYLRVGAGGAGWLLTEGGKLTGAKPEPLTDGNGTVITDKNGDPVYGRHDPAGFSLGGKLAVGMMVALDFLEPMRALHARAKGIYRHTFIFMEVAAHDAGLNQNEVMRLVTPKAQSLGWDVARYFGPTMVVGMERLPLITGGLAISF